jgi:hypothetical protein
MGEKRRKEKVSFFLLFLSLLEVLKRYFSNPSYSYAVRESPWS